MKKFNIIAIIVTLILAIIGGFIGVGTYRDEIFTRKDTERSLKAYNITKRQLVKIMKTEKVVMDSVDYYFDFNKNCDCEKDSIAASRMVKVSKIEPTKVKLLRKYIKNFLKKRDELAINYFRHIKTIGAIESIQKKNITQVDGASEGISRIKLI